MDKRFPQYDELDLPKVAEEVLTQWEAEDTFGRSLELRKDAPPFVFYEGPPSANGLPGIHHVMARTAIVRPDKAPRNEDAGTKYPTGEATVPSRLGGSRLDERERTISDLLP
jgi:hypothetical protein